MGLLSSSKSKSSTSQNQVGSQTQLGDPTSVSISGNAKTNIAVNLNKVDHGSVAKSFALANKVVDSHKDVLKVANNFALDTVAAAQKVSSEIIEAGQYSAGATERIAQVFEAFVDEQKNPDNKNTTLLIVGAIGVLVLLVKVKK